MVLITSLAHVVFTYYFHTSLTSDMLTMNFRHITLNITAPTNNENDLLSLEISADTTVGTLKDSVQAETQISKTSQHLYHNGQLLNDDSKTMTQLSIGDGEMLALHVRDMRGVTGVPANRPLQPPVRQQVPTQSRSGQPDPETIRLQLLGNPNMRQAFIDQRPDLADTIEDPQRFAQALQNLEHQEREEQNRRRQHIEDLNADPFDIDAQMRIAEMIREERVQENLQNAIEHTPEGKHPSYARHVQLLIMIKYLVESICCILMLK